MLLLNLQTAYSYIQKSIVVCTYLSLKLAIYILQILQKLGPHRQMYGIISNHHNEIFSMQVCWFNLHAYIVPDFSMVKHQLAVVPITI